MLVGREHAMFPEPLMGRRQEKEVKGVRLPLPI
jgi:hypothetical protein